MATLISPSGSSPSGRDAPFRVATREVSLDFSTVGPDQSPNELGAMSDAAFRTLLEKFAGIPPVKLIDGDPQLVVSAKRGRFILLPSNGKVLLRPANDPQQPYVKYAPDDVPGFLDATDQPAQTQAPAKNFQTLIGSAAAMVADADATIPPRPPAPIYGAFPDKPGKSAATTSGPAAASAKPAAPPAPKFRRSLVVSFAALLLVVAGGTLWVFYGPAPAEKPQPPPPPSEFDRIAAPDLLANLKKRYVGAYATSGETGERLLEIRADGSFHYQEFGTGVSRTTNRSGTYIFAFRHATKTPLIRASALGTIELRDEKTLVCEGAVFTRLP